MSCNSYYTQGLWVTFAYFTRVVVLYVRYKDRVVECIGIYTR